MRSRDLDALYKILEDVDDVNEMVSKVEEKLEYTTKDVEICSTCRYFVCEPDEDDGRVYPCCSVFLDQHPYWGVDYTGHCKYWKRKCNAEI